MSDLGRSFRRLRQVRGIKQAYAAELLGVSQATISRWETGARHAREALENAYARLSITRSQGDAALKRLVEESLSPTHLVCDTSHTLLAASRQRALEWQDSVSVFLGRSLFKYASREIQEVEARLSDLGWYDAEAPALAFWTGANADESMRIRPSLVLWERVRLHDGRDARLVTTVSKPPAHAHLL